MARSQPPRILAVLASVLYTITLVSESSAAGHSYKDGEEIPIFANKVGPFSNPSETYEFFTLPYCGNTGKYQTIGLGEVLRGDRKVRLEKGLKFKGNVKEDTFCTAKLFPEDLESFRQAIASEFFFIYFIDDLPVYGFVGEKQQEGDKLKYFLFTGFHFKLEYGGNKIISASLSAFERQEISEPKENGVTTVQFKYRVSWSETDLPWDRRMERLAQTSFLPKNWEIRWFSILNSFVTVILLVAFLATVLMRVLRKDFYKYTRALEDGDDFEDSQDEGWKTLTGDVFRFPPMPGLMAAFLGNGAQLLILVAGIVSMATLGVYYPYNRGAIYTAAVVLFALTSCVSGYVSAKLYRQFGGTTWIPNLLLTTLLFLGPIILAFAVNNSIAWYYESTSALPFGTVVAILAILLLVSFPLTIAGGVVGKNRAGEFYAPCRVTRRIPREIPEVDWYRRPATQTLLAGVLPFSAIYIELYYVFSSVWGHKIYQLYGVLLLVFLLLLLVTAFVTVALTYFQLNAEDHQWWWRSFCFGGSVALFVYAYCFYYFTFRTGMSGLMQTSWFFGYMLVMCYGLFIMLGTVGFYSSLTFVRYIYRAIKSD